MADTDITGVARASLPATRFTEQEAAAINLALYREQIKEDTLVRLAVKEWLRKRGYLIGR